MIPGPALPSPVLYTLRGSSSSHPLSLRRLTQTPAGLRLRQRKGTLSLKKEEGEKRERMWERKEGASGSIDVEAKLPSSLPSNQEKGVRIEFKEFF